VSGFVFVLFFLFGRLTSLNDVLIPKLNELFSLSSDQAMPVRSAFFIGYLIASVPAGFLVNRIGYMRAAAAGLLIMAAGCLLFGEVCIFLYVGAEVSIGSLLVNYLATGHAGIRTRACR